MGPVAAEGSGLGSGEKSGKKDEKVMALVTTSFLLLLVRHLLLEAWHLLLLASCYY